MFRKWSSFKKAWVKALRSGRYKRGKGVLVTDRDEFCCLGVAANLLIENGHPLEWVHFLGGWGVTPPKDFGNSHFKFPECFCLSYLCRGVLPGFAKGALTMDVQVRLAGMNDDDANNFDDIANYIEKHL